MGVLQFARGTWRRWSVFRAVLVVFGSCCSLVVADKHDVARQLCSIAKPAQVLERHLLSPGLADVDASRDDDLHLLGLGLG